MKFGLIYKATCIISGKHYIGQSTSYKRRFIDHRNESKRQNSSKYRCKFYSAIRKYGWDNFDWEILEDNIPEEFLNMKECEWIQGFNSYYKGYNSSMGGEVAPTKNPEVAKKVSDSKKGKPTGHIPWNKGKKIGPMNEEQKAKHLAAVSGKPGPNTGRKFSEESKAKMAQAKLGKPGNKKGKKLTPEQRANISKAKKGVKWKRVDQT